jgi:hypothetical protein
MGEKVLKIPRSKALDSVCLFHSHFPPIATQSLMKEARGNYQFKFFSEPLSSFLVL